MKSCCSGECEGLWRDVRECRVYLFFWLAPYKNVAHSKKANILGGAYSKPLDHWSCWQQPWNVGVDIKRWERYSQPPESKQKLRLPKVVYRHHRQRLTTHRRMEKRFRANFRNLSKNKTARKLLVLREARAAKPLWTTWWHIKLPRWSKSWKVTTRHVSLVDQSILQWCKLSSWYKLSKEMLAYQGSALVQRYLHTIGWSVKGTDWEQEGGGERSKNQTYQVL